MRKANSGAPWMAKVFFLVEVASDPWVIIGQRGRSEKPLSNLEMQCNKTIPNRIGDSNEELLVGSSRRCHRWWFAFVRIRSFSRGGSAANHVLCYLRPNKSMWVRRVMWQ